MQKCEECEQFRAKINISLLGLNKEVHRPKTKFLLGLPQTQAMFYVLHLLLYYL